MKAIILAAGLGTRMKDYESPKLGPILEQQSKREGNFQI